MLLLLLRGYPYSVSNRPEIISTCITGGTDETNSRDKPQPGISAELANTGYLGLKYNFTSYPAVGESNLPRQPSRKMGGAGMKVPKVLLVGKSEADFGQLRQRFEQRECTCRFASSYSDAAALFSELRFDLILCSGQPGIRTLVSSVIGSSASLFCAHAIEDSCLWVPVISHGDECLGLPPLSPSEFSAKIWGIIDEIRQSSAQASGAAE